MSAMGRKRTLAAPAVDQPDADRQQNSDQGADDRAVNRQAAHRAPGEPADDGEHQEESAGGVVASSHRRFMPEEPPQLHRSCASSSRRKIELGDNFLEARVGADGI